MGLALVLSTIWPVITHLCSGKENSEKLHIVFLSALRKAKFMCYILVPSGATESIWHEQGDPVSYCIAHFVFLSWL